MKLEDMKAILELLKEIDELACDSRGCYENARGNDRACYEATEKIRVILSKYDVEPKGGKDE